MAPGPQVLLFAQGVRNGSTTGALPANGADLESAVWTVRDDGWLDDHPLTWAFGGTLVRYGSYSTHACRPILWWVPTCHCLRPRRLGAPAILLEWKAEIMTLEWKAEVNARLPSDTTPLFAAVVVQSPACVRLLLQSGARADVHPLGFLGYIQIRPRTALSDH